MSSLIISGAAAAGSAFVRTAGQFALSTATQAISFAFDNRNFEGPRLNAFQLMTSRDGAPMPQIYGRNRISGQVIWASRLRETSATTDVGKGGGPTQTNYSYSISFALGLCEGVIDSVERLWINGQISNLAAHNVRVYTGTEDQLPDPIISAIDGPDAPAFRGTAYIVFEDFPLDEYGARLPQMNAEILRSPSLQNDNRSLEQLVRGVNLLPSSGEYAYATDIVEDVTGPGAAVPVNMNNLSGKADVEHALDQLETRLPNCKNVSIIISWFGTDLRVGECQILPGVESRERLLPWRVGSDTRDIAYLLSRDENDRPYYGGTPTDKSIVQTIQSLKSRGMKVTIYPFILMDIVPGNGLPDPYGGAEQGAFPWRGRITSTQDGSASVTSEVDAFFGQCLASDFTHNGTDIDYTGPDEYSFRRFILHHAMLAELAGGVDRFIIGSEMRGLTTLSSAPGIYPSVERLGQLADDVQGLLRPSTGISYAADWSEYFGHQANGNVYYHLDPLWSRDSITAIGIDAYMPLSDWRDGQNHLDAEQFPSIYDLEYLSSNMEGGEGYDWFYASDEDRALQNRTPITDGAYARPWVYRYKDLRNWWGNLHYNRPNGIEQANPTGWVPESKPIWLTEIGCPAIDKGANQPNVFVDPKSAESFAPYFSSGTRDDLIQRRYNEAFISYWETHNPVSSLDGRPMIDLDGIHVWSWDARPYPDFPARTSIWSDGPNWNVGHWLTGRTGLVPVRDVVSDLCTQNGIETFNVERLNGLVTGYMVERPMRIRDALAPLAAAYSFDLFERADGLTFISHGSEDVVTLSSNDFIETGFDAIATTYPEATFLPQDVRLTYIDAARDFQLGSLHYIKGEAQAARTLDVSVPLVMDVTRARILAKRILEQSRDQGRHIEAALSPLAMRVDIGDRIRLLDMQDTYRVSSSQGGLITNIRLEPVSETVSNLNSGVDPVSQPSPAWIAEPVPVILDIADYEGSDRQGVLTGVQLTPFRASQVSTDFATVNINAGAKVGRLLSPLLKGPIGYFDRSHSFDMFMPQAVFSTLETLALLSGANRFAIKTELGWEILQAQSITLVGEHTWRCATLLRGLAGTDVDMQAVIDVGAEIVALTNDLVPLTIPSDLLGTGIDVLAQAGLRQSLSGTHSYEGRELRPLSPAHLKFTDDGEYVYLTWIRRTRKGGDSWAGLDVPLGEDIELYQITLLNDDSITAQYEVSQPEWNILSQDFTALGQIDKIEVRQGSTLYGWGAAGQLHL